MPVAADTGRTNRLRYDKAARKQRLDNNVMTLYHATDSTAAQQIRSTKKFLRGQGGASGGGIYFATSREAALRYAHPGLGRPSVVFECKVKLGAVETNRGSYTSLQFISLQNNGKDSIRQSPDVYVVYNYDQVEIIREV
ncbi:unnamed protein product [Amoebophrya sp. A25]|nr:unnamed protein product [Amoebophrya sp. A25]|eukprot:GSA25T00003665001.1